MSIGRVAPSYLFVAWGDPTIFFITNNIRGAVESHRRDAEDASNLLRSIKESDGVFVVLENSRWCHADSLGRKRCSCFKWGITFIDQR